MCCALEVSVSGDSAWRKRQPSQHSREDAELAGKITTAFEAAIGVSLGAHLSMRSCMRKGGMARENGSLVSCESWSWGQNVHVIQRSRRKASKEHQSLRTCSNRTYMLINPPRNGR